MEEEKVVVVSDADPVKRRDVVVVPVAETEQEFEAKSLALSDEFFEVGLQEFLGEVFEREDARTGEMGVQPFEEVQSAEYRNWRQQKQQLAVKRSQGVPEEQLVMDYSGYGCWRYNPIVFYQEVVDGQKKNRHRIILKDDDASLLFISGRKFAIMSPITYVGRNNTQENARYLYAMAFDLDGVSMRCHRKMFELVEKGIMPMPNLIVNSGHGYHLYYLLENPVALYPVIVPLLNRVKHGLTNILWNMGTSELEDRQYQSILQSFRLPGTLTKFGKRIRAFVTRSDRYTLEDLNGYLSKYKLSPEELFVCTGKAKYNPKGVTLSEAERMWPEWYFSRVVQKKRVGRKWHVNRAVYDWWHNTLLSAGDEIKVHHRYWCILTLVIYAVKCDIPRDEVLADALALVPKMDSYTDTEDNRFTEDDVHDAMLAYDENYNKWPIKTIEDTTLFRIERNRRNGRPQEEHVKMMSLIRDNISFPDGSWRKGNGRKAQGDIVKQWREENPNNNNKSQCAKETGLSRPTVRKWWDPDKVVVSAAVKPQVKKAEEPENKPVLVDVIRLFAPESTYTIPGYTHEEVVEIMTTGRWKDLGWEVIFS